MKPTIDAYRELQTAYDHFNRELYDNALPACLLTFQREKRSFGYFSRNRFISAETGETTHEIAMNPAYFATGPLEEIMQTLVHEMAHLWQQEFGTPGRRGYHNKEWGDKMESIGLMPSSTGQPGGKKTGECMADYIIPGGRFEASCAELLTNDFRITWMDRFVVQRNGAEVPAFISDSFAAEAGSEGGESMTKPGGNASNRWKYSCPTCPKINVWGKPEMKLKCGECDSVLAGEG